MTRARLLMTLALAALVVLDTAPAGARNPFEMLFGDGPSRRPARAPQARTTEKPTVAKKRAPEKKPAGRTQEAAAPPPSEATPARDTPRPYDPQFLRLAEVVGALSFLRNLCKAGDGDDWRGKMTALLDADAPSGLRRQQLVGAFNRGFRGFELTYRACTPNAQAAVARYLTEAEHITADVAYRYGAP